MIGQAMQTTAITIPSVCRSFACRTCSCGRGSLCSGFLCCRCWAAPLLAFLVAHGSGLVLSVLMCSHKTAVSVVNVFCIRANTLTTSSFSTNVQVH